MEINGSIFYKYYPYNEYLLEMLCTKKAWYSKPEAFNDPFDCYLNFDEVIPEDRYERCLRGQLKREGRSQSQIEGDIEKLLSRDGEVHKAAKTVIDEISSSTLDVVRNIGVYCLTEINNNVTMWSHYADNHKGLCVGFLISEGARPEKVTYVHEAPRVNFSNLFDEGSGEDEYKWIFSKHLDWKHEREWRKVVPQGNHLWPIPGKIKNVIFGLRMDNSKRKVIEKILENEVDIEYFEAIKKPNLLQLEIKRIEKDKY